MRATNLITHMSLRQSSLGDEGIGPIVKMLRNNSYPTLTSIDLGRNGIRATGLKQLVEALSRNFHVINFIVEEDIPATDTGLVAGEALDMPSLQKRIKMITDGNRQYAACQAGTARDLKLSLRLLPAFPEGVLSMTNLCTLDLSYNSITAIPTEIEHLVSLERLNLQKNQIEIVPAQVRPSQRATFGLTSSTSALPASITSSSCPSSSATDPYHSSASSRA